MEGTAKGKPEGTLRWFRKENPVFIALIILFIIIAFLV